MNSTYLLCLYIPLMVCIWLVLRRRRWAGFHQAARRRRDKGFVCLRKRSCSVA